MQVATKCELNFMLSATWHGKCNLAWGYPFVSHALGIVLAWFPAEVVADITGYFTGI